MLCLHNHESQVEALPLWLKLWVGTNPMRERGLYTVFRGYVDESFNPQFFVLSCIFAKVPQWIWVVNDWIGCVEEKNKELRDAGRREIPRVHASPLNAQDNEFEGWSRDEAVEFVKKLLGVFRKPSNNMSVVCYALDLKDLAECIPSTKDDPKGFAYALLLKMLMIEMGHLVEAANNGDVSRIKISLFHERCGYDAILQNAFAALLKDKTFRYSSVFPSLTPIGWEDCAPLQPADFMAYENFKEVQRLGIRPDAEMRKSLKTLLGRMEGEDEKGYIGIRVKGFTRKNLEDLKSLMDAMTTELLNAQARVVNSGNAEASAEPQIKGEQRP